MAINICKLSMFTCKRGIKANQEISFPIMVLSQHSHNSRHDNSKLRQRLPDFLQRIRGNIYSRNVYYEHEPPFCSLKCYKRYVLQPEVLV
jgi:hypothetical protein